MYKIILNKYFTTTKSQTNNFFYQDIHKGKTKCTLAWQQMNKLSLEQVKIQVCYTCMYKRERFNKKPR